MAALRGLTLDAGALIGYERGATAAEAAIETATRAGSPITVPAVVVAETWRGGPRSARVARLLRECDVEPLDEELARAAGVLLARTPGADTVDACVAASALRRHDAVATSDPGDLAELMPADRLIEV